MLEWMSRRWGGERRIPREPLWCPPEVVTAVDSSQPSLSLSSVLTYSAFVGLCVFCGSCYLRVILSCIEYLVCFERITALHFCLEGMVLAYVIKCGVCRGEQIGPLTNSCLKGVLLCFPLFLLLDCISAPSLFVFLRFQWSGLRGAAAHCSCLGVSRHSDGRLFVRGYAGGAIALHLCLEGLKGQSQFVALGLHWNIAVFDRACTSRTLPLLQTCSNIVGLFRAGFGSRNKLLHVGAVRRRIRSRQEGCRKSYPS